MWAVILAAGESKRMGRPKMLLPFGENTIIETVVETVVSSSIENTLVVLGAEREKIEEKISRFPIGTVFNARYREGMLSSVRCGLRALPAEARAMLVVLGDQPALSAGIIDQIAAAYMKTAKGIVVPRFGEERGHPIVIDLKYRDEIERLSPDTGLRGVVYAHDDDVLEIEVSSPAILHDIDDEDDYRQALEDRP